MEGWIPTCRRRTGAGGLNQRKMQNGDRSDAGADDNSHSPPNPSRLRIPAIRICQPGLSRAGDVRDIESTPSIFDANPQLLLRIDADCQRCLIGLGMFDNGEQQFADGLKEEHGLDRRSSVKWFAAEFDRHAEVMLFHLLAQPGKRLGPVQIG